jgi:hypothetical protein
MNHTPRKFALVSQQMWTVEQAAAVLDALVAFVWTRANGKLECPPHVQGQPVYCRRQDYINVMARTKPTHSMNVPFPFSFSQIESWLKASWTNLHVYMAAVDEQRQGKALNCDLVQEKPGIDTWTAMALGFQYHRDFQYIYASEGGMFTLIWHTIWRKLDSLKYARNNPSSIPHCPGTSSGREEHK